ncbi:hypothetical protein KP509_27G066700 [Ceratopteris richardii]|uniref:Probable zinc-ribbon domain-containing protein n=1 Tax=Ceratopteris richardii TaxID=49495 RepID=A0A8T2RJB3_CERRI|nr:hypothetical protein KP509_27G066700 [Ceratopteris richardii]
MQSSSANDRCTIMEGFPFERGSTCPRFNSMEEDLYLHQGVHPNHVTGNHLTQGKLPAQQRIPHVDKQFYPITNPIANHQIGVSQSHNGATSLNMMNGLDPHRATYGGSMIDYNNALQTQNYYYEGNHMGPLAYPIHSSSISSHGHPYSRLQEYNRYSTNGSYPFHFQSSDGSATFSNPLQQFRGLPYAHHRDFPIFTSSKCACCTDHFQTHLPPHFVQTVDHYPFAEVASHYTASGYQHLQTHPHLHDHMFDGKFRPFSSHSSLRSFRSRRRTTDSVCQAHAAALARKENCPPLPGRGAPPYVLCQQCGKVLHIPARFHFDGAVLKLRCGACRSISKFCNIVHPCYQELFRGAKATVCLKGANNSNYLNRNNSLLRVANVGKWEPDFIAQEPMAEKHNEDLKAGCVGGVQHEREVKKNIMENWSPNEVQHCSPMPKRFLEGVKENGQGEQSYFVLDTLQESHYDSSHFSASKSCLTKDTANPVSHDEESCNTSELISQCSMHVEGAETKVSVDALDLLSEQGENSLRLTSEELEGLMLECIRGSSYTDMKQEIEAGGGLQNSGFRQDNHDVPLSSDNNNGKGSSLATEEHFSHLELNEEVGFEDNAKQTLADCNSMEEIHGQKSQGTKKCDKTLSLIERTSSAPDPVSTFYEHLTYDSASELRKAVSNTGEGGKTLNVPPTQIVCKGIKFLPSFLRKSLSLGSTGHTRNRYMSVVVNGVVIPRDAVRSAEKQAGTISPGVYWYDYEAGFWGVMGGPCLGIIPPCIKEFNSSLSRDCAGGNTGILINGRELHKKDLDLLASRGLPKTPGKAYLVDINGLVVEESSGKVFERLGRLAPTYVSNVF